jgi:hypothetical protein
MLKSLCFKLTRAALASVEFQSVVDDIIAEFPGYLVLQGLDAVRMELYDIAGVEVDQMIVMIAVRLLET